MTRPRRSPAMSVCRAGAGRIEASDSSRRGLEGFRWIATLVPVGGQPTRRRTRPTMRLGMRGQGRRRAPRTRARARRLGRIAVAPKRPAPTPEPRPRYEGASNLARSHPSRIYFRAAQRLDRAGRWRDGTNALRWPSPAPGKSRLCNLSQSWSSSRQECFCSEGRRVLRAYHEGAFACSGGCDSDKTCGLQGVKTVACGPIGGERGAPKAPTAGDPVIDQ